MPAHESTAESDVTENDSRLRRLSRGVTSFHLGLLGLLAVPGWLFESLEFMQVFGLFFLFFLWPLVAPLFTWLVERDDQPEPTDWIHMGDWTLWVKAYLMVPLTVLNPVILTQDAMQLLGMVPAYVRHRGSLPAPGRDDQRVSYRLPFEGTWTVVNGGHEQEHSHSWFPVTQRYAYDFVITDEDGRSRPEGTNAVVENYYCYDEPVLAPADGVVVEAWDSAAESRRADGLSHVAKRDLRGGFVVLQHAPEEFSSLVHLVPGSLAVEVGEHVERGQQVGRCGHSGNSSEPHLHFQVQDHPRFELAAGLPVQFDDIFLDSPLERDSETERSSTDDGSGPSTADTTSSTDYAPDLSSLTEGKDGHGEHHSRTFVRRGQRVKHADEETSESSETGQPKDSSTTFSPVNPVLSLLQRFAFGLCVAGVVAFFVGIVASWAVIAALLGSGAVAAIVSHYWVRFRREGYTSRAGWAGSVVGVGLVGVGVVLAGTLEAGVGVRSLGGLSFICGLMLYTIVGEYDRLRLRTLLEAREDVTSRRVRRQ